MVRAGRKSHDRPGHIARCATDLARLWQQQGRSAPARDLVAPIYARFTEGFATADLEAAKALLGSLGVT